MDTQFVIEKDYIDKKTGKRCLIVFNRMGIRCAYVEVDKQIPLSAYYDNLKIKTNNTCKIAEILSSRHEYSFSKANIEVHGGITFADKLDYIDNETKFVGIDFAHYGDLRDLDAYKEYFGRSDYMYETLNKLNIFEKKLGKLYKIEDVQLELDKLAIEVYRYEQRELSKLKQIKKYNWKHRGEPRRKRWETH